MEISHKLKIEDHWKQYLPLKYVTIFEVNKPITIRRTVKSKKHQTDNYIVEPFYKVTSKIRPI